MIHSRHGAVCNPMDAVAGNAVCFGPFKLDLKAGELLQDGRKSSFRNNPSKF